MIDIVQFSLFIVKVPSGLCLPASIGPKNHPASIIYLLTITSIIYTIPIECTQGDYQLKIKAIACEVFARELSYAAAISPHRWDIKFMPFGLHDTPDKLRAAVQEEINATNSNDYDFIVLAYGLCSRGTADVTAKSIPLIIPRAHDCITLFLGSRAKYNQEFSAHPGTYYYSSGWIERKDGDVQQGFTNAHEKRISERYQEYVEKYGEDNAKFLIEQETHWLSNYSRAAFINTGLGDIAEYRKFIRQLSKNSKWEYAEIEGDMSLIRSLANGDWDNDDFLKVEPGQTITESFDKLILISK